jgi:hypothetical protein
MKRLLVVTGTVFPDCASLSGGVSSRFVAFVT